MRFFVTIFPNTENNLSDGAEVATTPSHFCATFDMYGNMFFSITHSGFKRKAIQIYKQMKENIYLILLQQIVLFKTLEEEMV